MMEETHVCSSGFTTLVVVQVRLCVIFFFFFPWLDSNHHTVSLREITQRVSYSIDSLQAAGVDSDQRH